MRISRRALLLGTAGCAAVGAGLLSIPGGGPRTFFGGVAPSYDLPPAGQEISPKDMRAELDWLVSTLREVGVTPFAYTSQAAFESAHAATSQSFTQPASVLEFYRRVGRLFASLNDGHAGVDIGAHYDRFRERGGLAFPLALDLHPNAILVAPYPGSPLPARTEVLKIDGQPAARVAAEVVRFVGAQRLPLRYAFAGNWVNQIFWVLWGERRYYDVVARLPGADVRSIRIPAKTRKQIEVAVAAAPHAAQAPYTFERIAGGRVGYIDYRRCEDYERFSAFLRETFTSIARDPIDGLIIDIRENGGGQSSLNDLLWDYVTDKPYAQGGASVVKVSDRLKREYGFAKYNDVYPPPSWLWPNGSTVRFPAWTSQRRPSKNDLRYRGPVFLLIGIRTFSSALLCAVAAKDFSLATIVGEETGEPVDSTGEVYSGYSPRLGIGFAFTTKFFYGGKARPIGQGVVPDVRVVPTLEDLIAGRDPVRERAVNAILHRR